MKRTLAARPLRVYWLEAHLRCVCGDDADEGKSIRDVRHRGVWTRTLYAERVLCTWLCGVRDKNRWVNARAHTLTRAADRAIGLVWQTENERCQRIQREYVDGMVPLCIKINSAHSSPPLATTLMIVVSCKTEHTDATECQCWSLVLVCAPVRAIVHTSYSYKCLFASVRDSTCASSARVQVVDLSSLVRHTELHTRYETFPYSQPYPNQLRHQLTQYHNYRRVYRFFGRRFASYWMNELNFIFVLSCVHSALYAARIRCQLRWE